MTQWTSQSATDELRLGEELLLYTIENFSELLDSPGVVAAISILQEGIIQQSEIESQLRILAIAFELGAYVQKSTSKASTLLGGEQ